MDLVLHVVHKMALWRWWLMPIAIVGSLAVAGAASAATASGGRPRARLIWLPPVCIVLAILNFNIGTGVSARLIHAYGKAGQAVATGSYATGTVYNGHDVLGYDVLLKTADGRTVETRFQEDDFNVYPPRNAATYPGVGEHFNVRYLPSFPNDFVIVSDDDSPWARGLRCEAARTRLAEASRKVQFAGDNPAYRQAYLDAVHAVSASGNCPPDEVRQDGVEVQVEQ